MSVATVISNGEAMMPTSRTPSLLRGLRFALRAALLLWAAFWAWFVLAVSLGEDPAPPWWIPVAWLAALLVLVALGWKCPRLGGALLIAAAIAAAIAFPDPGARALLAVPAAGLGLGCSIDGWGARRAARVGLLGVLFLPLACRAPQDPADLPFRTSSILRHENGRMQRAELVAPTEIGGFPCRSWVWWYEDGALDNFALATDFEVQGHALPADTRVFLDREGRLAHAWLSRETLVDGRPCRGRWKIDTAFHPNGRVRAFFPPETLAIDGVSCAASVFHPVYLHPDGHLRQCRLAADVTLDGRRFQRGRTIVLDETGRPR
jgi:hypothetical protein